MSTVRAAHRTFVQRSHRALLDDDLRAALGRARGGFVEQRREAVEALPESERPAQAGWQGSWI